MRDDLQPRRNPCELKCDLYASFITARAIGRIQRLIIRKSDAWRSRKFRNSAAIGANGFIDDPLLIETARSAIHMIPKTLLALTHYLLHLAEKASIKLTGSILLQNEKIKIRIIRSGTDGAARG